MSDDVWSDDGQSLNLAGGYAVEIASGPAKGWSYTTMIEPDPVIAVAPLPGEAGARGEFFRVPSGTDEPWPGQHTYRRTTKLTVSGGTLMMYRVAE